MQVLIIDCWENTHFEAFQKIVKRNIARKLNGEGNKPNIIVRQLDELSDYACHWEHDTLDDKSKARMCKFDKLDMIFICGDMRMVPWDPMYMQVITIIFMCILCRKPIYCCGSAAYAAVYTVATQGSRFHILNGPSGDSISNLPKFPRFSFGSGPFPSGWLDNNTGDVYVYNRDNKSWIPNCNIGMYRIATAGKPTNNKVGMPAKRYSREDHYLKARRPEAIEEAEDICFVRNEYLQHYSVRNMQTQEFVTCPLNEWHLNHESALPTAVGIQVICCNSHGPVILALDFMLIVAIDMAAKSGVDVIATTVDNFIDYSISALRNCSLNDTVNRSLFVHIFGYHGLGGGKFDSVTDSKPRSPPLASKTIKSSLPKGPTYIDTPVYGMFFKEVDPGTFDLTALMSPRTNTSMGRAPVNVLRDPQMNHMKRIVKLVSDSGYKGLGEVCQQAFAQTQEAAGLESAFLDSTKAAMAGRIIHTNNIRERRTMLFTSNEEKPKLPRPASRGAVQGTTSFILSSPSESKRSGEATHVDQVEMNTGAFTILASTATNAGQSQAVGGLHTLPTFTAQLSNTDRPGGEGLPNLRPRPSSASVATHSSSFVPVHHPKIRRPSSAKVPTTQPERRRTIYFVDDDDDIKDERQPVRPPRESAQKFVQPSRTVYVVPKSAPQSRKPSMA